MCCFLYIGSGFDIKWVKFDTLITPSVSLNTASYFQQKLFYHTGAKSKYAIILPIFGGFDIK